MVPIMIPLLIITILFHRYLQQQHLRVASTLPVMECHEIDETSKKGGLSAAPTPNTGSHELRSARTQALACLKPPQSMRLGVSSWLCSC